MRTWHSTREPDDLIASLVFELGQLLNGRGYRLVSRGPAGVAFRRAAGTPFWAGIALTVLGVLLVGGGPLVALIMLVAGVSLIVTRFPATVNITIRGDDEGRRVDASRVSGPLVWAAIERAV